PRGGAGAVASIDGLVLGRRRLGQALMRNRILELAHPGAERTSDLGDALGPEEQERDQEQQREVGRTGPADHVTSSLNEMSVTASPATATSRRSGRSSSQSV